MVTGYILVPRIPIQQSFALCPMTYSLLSALRPIFILVDALLSRTYAEYGPIDHTYPYSTISPTQPGPIQKSAN